MTPSDLQPLRAILQQARRRYLTVRPHGFELNPGQPLRPTLEVRILSFGSARTLYQNRKPLCRSLDAIRPTAPKAQRSCPACALRPRCTLLAEPFLNQASHTPMLVWIAPSALLEAIRLATGLTTRAPKQTAALLARWPTAPALRPFLRTLTASRPTDQLSLL